MDGLGNQGYVIWDGWAANADGLLGGEGDFCKGGCGELCWEVFVKEIVNNV